MHSPLIAGLGEILWDIFPDGATFGGAPANFACSAAGLAGDQANVFMLSAVGKDELGNKALDALRQKNVRVEGVAQLSQPTGQVLVSLDAEGKASYEFAADTAWDNLPWSPELELLAKRCDAVCFGSLGQRSRMTRETIRQFVTTVRTDCLRIFDINLRPPFFTDEVVLKSLEIANTLKLNDEELPYLAGLLDMSGNDGDQLRQLADRFEIDVVALTRGENGAMLLRGQELAEIEGQSVAVVDTVGAGDAFTAAMTHGLLARKPLESILNEATKVAAYVCTQSGATPDLASMR